MPIVSNGHYQKINSHYSQVNPPYATVILPSSNIPSSNTPRGSNNYAHIQQQQQSKYLTHHQSQSSPRTINNYEMGIENYAHINPQHYHQQQHHLHQQQHGGNYQKVISLQQASPSLNNSNEYGW
jgi:hypothetical protein